MPDSLIVELYEMLERDPRSVFLHERLIEAWDNSGEQGT